MIRNQLSFNSRRTPARNGRTIAQKRSSTIASSKSSGTKTKWERDRYVHHIQSFDPLSYINLSRYKVLRQREVGPNPEASH